MKTKKQFLKEVHNEIEHLKSKTTIIEKSRLNVETFDHGDAVKCIYGQMTGNCQSDRAKELYPKIYGDINNTSKGIYLTALEKYLYMINQENRIEILLYIKDEAESYNKEPIINLCGKWNFTSN